MLEPTLKTPRLERARGGGVRERGDVGDGGEIGIGRKGEGVARTCVREVGRVGERERG